MQTPLKTAITVLFGFIHGSTVVRVSRARRDRLRTPGRATLWSATEPCRTVRRI